jgi:hypothetical protein
LKDVEVHMLEQVNMAMLEWQNKNMSLNQLWKLPETQFVASQKALTDWVEWSVNVQGDHITVHGTALKQRN